MPEPTTMPELTMMPELKMSMKTTMSRLRKRSSRCEWCRGARPPPWPNAYSGKDLSCGAWSVRKGVAGAGSHGSLHVAVSPPWLAVLTKVLGCASSSSSVSFGQHKPLAAGRTWRVREQPARAVPTPRYRQLLTMRLRCQPGPPAHTQLRRAGPKH